MEKNSPEVVFQLLQSLFDEGLTTTQVKRKFLQWQQKQKESIQDNSYSLMVLLLQVECLYPGLITIKTRSPVDQCVENLYNSQLRCDIIGQETTPQDPSSKSQKKSRAWWIRTIHP